MGGLRVEVKCGRGNVQPQESPEHSLAHLCPMQYPEDAVLGEKKKEGEETA